MIIRLLLVLCFVFSSLKVEPTPVLASDSAPYQGFGSTTSGGSRGKIFRVTSLEDSGSGSLRDAVSQGHRRIVFDVAGEIVLRNQHIPIKGSFITIDGSTAPSPGITIKDGGLRIWGKNGTHNIIVRGIRIRNAPRDGIQIGWGAHNIVIDRVSVHGSGDGNVDITEGAHDVTVSWSLLSAPASGKMMLIGYNPSRITLHHNLFIKSETRNPQVRLDSVGTSLADTTLDMRNNLIWDWGGGYGTLIRYGARANIVNNFYANPSGGKRDKAQAIIVCKGDGKETPESLSLCGKGDRRSGAAAYVADNLSADNLPPWDINSVGNEKNPFSAPSVTTREACRAAHKVVSAVGVHPRDLIDQQYLAVIALPPCVSG